MASKTAEASPIAGTERLEVLDVLRGFALLGIYILNVDVLSGHGFMSRTEARMLPLSSLDGTAVFLTGFLVRGKFYGLFSFLFGIGFGIFLQRADARGGRATAVFRRRLTGLLIIGVVHSILVWFGDILNVYALLGYLLILFRRCSERALLSWSLACLASPVVLAGLLFLVVPSAAPAEPADSASFAVPEFLETAIAGFADGDYPDVVRGNLAFTVAGWARRILNLTLPRIFGMFLLGYYTYRRGWFADPRRFAGTFGRLLSTGIAIGLPLGAAAAWLSDPGPFPFSSALGVLRVGLQSVSMPVLSLAYASALVLLFQRPVWRRGLMRLAPLGRMALTNYLMQSVAGIVVFYGIGFGLYEKTSLPLAQLIAVGFLLVQLVASRWWIRRWAYGPAEWIWRRYTYRRQSISAA